MLSRANKCQLRVLSQHVDSLLSRIGKQRRHAMAQPIDEINRLSPITFHQPALQPEISYV